MNLLIVESPNKVKKLQGYLDALDPNAWRVIATVGHWRGLPAMDGQAFEASVDPATWQERFAVQSADVERRLSTAIKGGANVFLAADNDREGEAIAWHVVDAFRLKGAKRVLFNEITKTAVEKAIDNAGVLDMNLVEAQRARQVLDYAMGMLVSRKLWRFGAKSAGRVQSAGLRIIVDREREIEAFQAKDFWTIAADYADGFRAAVATFVTPDEDELDAGDSSDKAAKLKSTRFFSMDDAASYISSGRDVPHVVEAVASKPHTRRPRPPYTTISLQADCFTRFGWGVAKTAKLAQKLFESSLVTYIRTDSVALADDAIADIRAYLKSTHPALLPDSPQKYADKSSAQGAHEAIRPVLIDNPDADKLTGDERTLYSAIWARTLACQAKSATVEKTIITVAPGDLEWRLLASGTVIKDAGWLTLEGEGGRKEPALPSVSVGQTLQLNELAATKSKTKPRSRFTEATLVKYLERNGIGRPATMASIVGTLQRREYIVTVKKQLAPGALGLLCDELLRTAFDALTQEGFTAKTEAALDKIAAGKLERTTFLDTFWAGLSKLLSQSDAAFGAYAKAHPDSDRDGNVAYDKPCIKCGGSMARRNSKNGPYATCDDEACGSKIDLTPLKKCKEPCPLCEGELVVQPWKKDGKKKTFVRCTRCDFKQTKPPVVDERPCPHCRGKVLLLHYVDKATAAKRSFWRCADEKQCGWSSSMSPPVTSKWACHNDRNHGPTTRLEGTAKKTGASFVQFVCHKCEDVKAGSGTFWSGPTPPSCPACHGPTKYRDSNRGDFWGCSTFPTCKGTLPIANN